MDNEIDKNAANIIYEKLLDALDENELFELCRKVSEKHLDKDNEMYKYFHTDHSDKRGDSV